MRGKRHGRLRRAGALLLAGGLALAGSGCGQGAPAARSEIRIGVCIYDEYDTFINRLMKRFSQDVTEWNEGGGTRVSITTGNAAASQTTQNEQVKSMIQEECDVICVNLVDRTDPSIIIDAAREADIPIIFFNRELVEEDLERWDRLYYVGADAFQSGMIQGLEVVDLYESEPRTDLNGDGILQYVMLEGEAGHQDSIVRTEYSVNTILNAGIPMEKLESSIANWNRAQAQTRMSHMLDLYEDRIELVLANNDDMALGAIDEYKAREIPRDKWPLILGIDGTDVGLEALQKGELSGTVYNDKEGQADAMLDLCIRLALGESLEDLPLKDNKYIRLEYEAVTRENVEDFLERAAE